MYREMNSRKPSGDSSVEVANDEEFFDEPLSRRGATKLAAAEGQSTPPADRSVDVNAATSQHSEHRNSSDSGDKSSTDRSAEEDGGASKHAIVIPSQYDSKPLDTKTASDASDAESTDREDNQTGDKWASAAEKKESQKNKSKEQTAGSKKKKKALTSKPKAHTTGLKHESPRKKNSTRSSTSSASKTEGDSSDDEQHHPKASREKRHESSLSGSHRQGKASNPRAASAPARKTFRSRPVSRSSTGSLTDVTELIETLLWTENLLSRRKSDAESTRFRRRRNFTFTDERLVAIERENKRLLDKIVTVHYSEPTYGTRSRQKHTVPVNPSSYANTQMKELHKIEMENLELLQRLQCIQPSRGVSREALLADYYRNQAYVGTCFLPPTQPSKGHRRRANSLSRN